MAAPTSSQIASFGPPISPFERAKKPDHQKVVHEAHANRDAFESKIHDARDDGHPAFPKPTAFATTDQIQRIINKDLEASERRRICYLWVINDQGINMLWEGIENLSDPVEKKVKHTNITGGGKAYHGGEVFFSDTKKIYVNNKSDRYGWSSNQQWDAVVSYFREVYSQFEVIDIRDEI